MVYTAIYRKKRNGSLFSITSEYGTKKDFERIVQEQDVTSYEDFLPILEQPKKKVKNKLYSSFAEKYNVKYSEEEWDNLVTELLTKHFEE